MACNEILLTETQGVALGWYERRRWRRRGPGSFPLAEEICLTPISAGVRSIGAVARDVVF